MRAKRNEGGTDQEGQVCVQGTSGGGKKEQGHGGLALEIMALVQESRGSGVGRHDLEEMVQKDIVRVYEKEEDTEDEKWPQTKHQ